MTPYFFGFTICFFVCRAWWGVGQVEPGAFCITATATCDWYNGHQRGGDWHKPALTEGTLKTYLQNEEEPRHQWTGSVLCDESHWGFHKTEWVLVPAMPKRRFGAHSWQSGGLAPFSRDPAFREGSAVATWDSWVACPWFWWQAFNRGWAVEAAGQDFAGSLSCSGQRLPVPRRFDSGCFRKHWPSTSCARQGSVPGRCTPAGRRLRVSWAFVRAVCLDSQSSQCQRYLVAQWSFGLFRVSPVTYV